MRLSHQLSANRKHEKGYATEDATSGGYEIPKAYRTENSKLGQFQPSNQQQNDNEIPKSRPDGAQSDARGVISSFPHLVNAQQREKALTLQRLVAE
jgi:hypothetical protein